MSVIEYFKEKGNKYYEKMRWEFKFNSVGNWIFYPYWWFMERERGLDFPFYFPEQKKFTEKKLAIFVEWLNNFVNLHEPERYAGDTSLTLIKRIKYVANNFIFYTNDTMSNLYYGAQLPLRDYQRLKASYLQLYLIFFGYNCMSGIFIIALNNYFFRNRKASIPVAVLASISTFVVFSLNYKSSYYIMDKVFSQQVRRLGYQHLIHEFNTYYPRNIDFLAH